MHEYKGCKKIKYVQSAQFTAVHTFIVFYSKCILNTLTNP
jgi:hypothetical protein